MFKYNINISRTFQSIFKKRKEKSSNVRFRDIMSKKRGRVITWPKAEKKEEEAQPVFLSFYGQ